MTTELTQPQAELGPDSATGQAQGHRRRRRRRKNKSSQAAAPQPQAQLQQPSPHTTQPPPAPRPAKHKQASAQQGRRQDAQPNQGRKKKSFAAKNSASAGQPGNSSSVQPQRKRKGTQKGPREFVGPMDHSYRVINGNIAEGPPSTIQLGSNGRNGGQYMDAYPLPPPVAVRPDAPPRIYCFIDDLFFVAKIQETARKLGVKVEFVKGDKEIVSRLAELPEEERPKLLVFDLNNLNAKPISLIPKFKTKFKKATSIVGFLNHLQGELRAKAIEAGCDSVMPRSAFSQTLPNLLRRYGIEEEEDNTPQPM
jgi:pyruvate/2-oxoglutarate dehydrogenase complex dihydrolipoamide acyltransferase (E2) component